MSFTDDQLREWLARFDGDGGAATALTAEASAEIVRELLERRQAEWARQAASLFPDTQMGRAARDALVLVLENDKQAANVLRLALPTFEEYFARAVIRSHHAEPVK